MSKLTERQKNILQLDFPEKGLSTSEITQKLVDASLVTVRRDIQELVKNTYLKQTGKGRGVIYHKTLYGTLMTPLNSTQYQYVDIDKRGGKVSYTDELFKLIPINIFSEEDLLVLDQATMRYRQRIQNVTPTIQKKELERFVIEMSWKSSKIEGNTYTLLDTERLIRDGIIAKGHTKDESIMILNHKQAFTFILEQKEYIQKNGVSQALLEKIHSQLVKDLGIDLGLRKSEVGITGTVYRPHGTEFQIREALEILYQAIRNAANPYQQALLALVGISYVQPFADGNKRTARLLANAFLIAGECAPLSYRNIDEVVYRDAILVFYEKNSIVSMKDIIVEQYVFAADNYLVSGF